MYYLSTTNTTNINPAYIQFFTDYKNTLENNFLVCIQIIFAGRVRQIAGQKDNKTRNKF